MSFWESLQDAVTWSVVIEIAGTILLAYVASWAFRHVILERAERMAKQTDNDVDDRLVYFLRRFYKGIVFFVVLIVIMRILRIELTPLLAGAGIAGIAVAYAAKDIVGNFLSGVFLLVDRPIKIGDRIRIERIGSEWGSWGDVVDVGLRTTTVKNTDGVLVTYPNGKLAESVIKNFSPRDNPMRFRVRVLVELRSDLDLALELMLAVAVEHQAILDTPAPSALVRSFYSERIVTPGALLELRCFVEDIRVRTRLRSELLIEIQKHFIEKEIHFIELDSEPLAAAISSVGEA